MRLGAGDGLSVELELRFFGKAIDKDEIGLVRPSMNFEADTPIHFCSASYCSGSMDAQAVLTKTPKVVDVHVGKRKLRAEVANGARLQRCRIDRRAIAPLRPQVE